MAEKKGRKELTEAVLAVIACENAGFKVAEDGKVGLDDVGVLFDVAPKLVVGVQGFKDIPAEVMDLDAEEEAGIAAEVATALTMKSEKAKKATAACLKILFGARDLGVALAEPDAPEAVAAPAADAAVAGAPSA